MRVRATGKPEGCKLLRIEAELTAEPTAPNAAGAAAAPHGGGIVLASITVSGDFFAVPEEGFETLEARLAGTRLADLAARFDALLLDLGVQAVGITGAGVAATLQGAIDGLSL
jgi:hypothetical protein